MRILLTHYLKILTNLPASDEAFLTGKAEVAPTMKDVLAGDIANLSPLGSVALMSCIFGLNLTHLHRPDSQDRENDVNGEFWKRHRAYDNILLNICPILFVCREVSQTQTLYFPT